jgi:DNA-binding response OmpR family regulator
MNVLLVEDQQRLSKALVAILTEAGYTVDAVFDGQSGLDYALLANYDAIVLDVMLPKKDGFEVMSELRRAGKDTPVIMLTARDTVRDKITGLDMGADDYLTKPFSPAELLARLRALTRRQGVVILETIKMGNTCLDLQTANLSIIKELAEKGEAATREHGGTHASTHDGTHASMCASTGGSDNQSVHLSQREFEVCKLLMASPNKTFSKGDILERVWGMSSDAEENSVEAYVSFLRKKLAYVGSNLNILTLRQLGYRMEVVA